MRRDSGLAVCGSVDLVLTEPWKGWAAARPASQVLHLDSGAAGRSSLATLDAVAAHARREATVGAYVALRDAQPTLGALRADVAELLGQPTDGVAFVESGTAGLEALLRAWPLPPDASVGVVAPEWGPNLASFAAHGLQVVELPHDGTGRVDLDALAAALADNPPTVVHLTQVTSHRGLVQPVAAALAVCRAADVPLWVDAAQALGHVDTAQGVDAVYSTSRKWLNGPRGVGLLAIAERWWDALRVAHRPMEDSSLPLRHVESHEAHIAGRIGLAQAVREYVELGPAAVTARLDEVGRLTREVLADTPGWEVAGSTGSAITALRPLAGQDVAAVREYLLAEHAILTTGGSLARAPRDGAGALLRVSPHVDATPDSLARLRSALPAR